MQIIIATIQCLNEAIIPAQQAEKIWLSVIESIRWFQPLKARLVLGWLLNAQCRGLKQERAFANVDRDIDIAASVGGSDMRPNYSGRSLGITCYRFGSPTWETAAVKVPGVFASPTLIPVPL